MLRFFAICALLFIPAVSSAQAPSDIVADAVNDHILPRYAELVDATSDLATLIQSDCQPGSAELEATFHDAFDAWIGVSHITFGPVEADGRYFALAFWPDVRSATGRSLTDLIGVQDAVVDDPAEFATVSVAARGFYALEFLLYDPQVATFGSPAYRCRLVQAISADIEATATVVRDQWVSRFSDLMLTAGTNDRFQSPEEATRVLFSAMTTGLEFTADLRLGRPLGSFDAPRPNRAEARRSGRALRHVALSLEALEDLGNILAQPDAELQGRLSDHFRQARDRVDALDDPVFAGVVDPQGRLRVEVLQQRVRDIHSLATAELGPSLGVAAGFNSLDGD